MAYAQHRFARVTKGPVTDVVQQQRAANEPPLVCDVGVVAKKIAADACELIERARAHRERSEGVRKTRVLRRGECEVSEPELAQPPQPLHDRQIEHPRFGCG